MPVTFEVDPTKKPDEYNHSPITLQTGLKPQLTKSKGRIITASNASKNYIRNVTDNGFVAAALFAYNNHHHLSIGPDEVWVSITSSLSRYITANAERLRDKFVSHEGKKELSVTASGTLATADYGYLISKISDQIDANTKGDIREWIECDFTTTTPIKRIVSKVILMAAMKEYFSYKFNLCCGLPKVTLLGTEEDWKKIRNKIEKLKEFDATLAEWSEVLLFVIDYFVAAFSGNVDTDFWNRIAHVVGGGSGPRYVEGWILSFVAFDSLGNYFLPSLSNIKHSNSFGTLDKNEVPPSIVQVPVKIDDNGKNYDTIIYAGAILPSFDDGVCSAVLDWVLVGIFITLLLLFLSFCFIITILFCMVINVL